VSNKAQKLDCVDEDHCSMTCRPRSYFQAAALLSGHGAVYIRGAVYVLQRYFES